MLLSDPDAPKAIAKLLGGRLRKAPFEVPRLPAGPEGQPPTQKREPVYQITLDSRELGRPLLILLWPSLNRVDVRLDDSTWTLRDVSEVELYPDVEVLFRRHEPPAFLFVSTGGRVALVA
ncbi:MAG: hypothetical protein HYS09_06995 [Chloroflexi bacterium]|nr:hypothetical protein [Chloroflexota bacterium]